MRRTESRAFLLGVLLVVGAVLGAMSAPRIFADTRVEGIVPITSAIPSRPVFVGASDGTVIRAIKCDTSGNLYGSIVGIDSGSTTRSLLVTTGGVLEVTQGLNFLTDTVTRIVPTASTGATAVTLLSGTSSQKIMPATMFFDNEDTITHTIILQSSGGLGIARFQLAAGGQGVIDGRGDLTTDPGEGLQFKLGEAGTTVYVSGSVVKR